MGEMAGGEEGFDEFAAATDGEIDEAFEPVGVGDFGVSVRVSSMSVAAGMMAGLWRGGR
jgi:hypothetical protein